MSNNKSIIPKDYSKIFIDLKNRIVQAQYRSYSAVNSEMIMAYLDIGKIISEKTKVGWGTSVIKKLSIDLQTEFNGSKGFSDRNIYRMRFIYDELMENSISPQAVAKLPWDILHLFSAK